MIWAYSKAWVVVSWVEMTYHARQSTIASKLSSSEEKQNAFLQNI